MLQSRTKSAAVSSVIIAVVIVVILVIAGIAGIAAYYKTAPAKQNTVIATLQGNSDFSTLVNALSVAALSGTLGGSTSYTIFAPTNEAFAALPSGVLTALLSNPTKLASVLNYHIVAGKVNETAMFELTSLVTLQGSSLPVGVAGTSLVVGGNGSLNEAAIPCTDGVIHPITSVLIPPTLITTLGTLTILQTAESLGLTYFVQGLTTANLASTLSGPGPYTVLAPTNGAMSAFSCTNAYANCFADLLANSSALAAVMQNNVIAGSYNSTQLVKLGSVTTLEGQTLVVTSASGVVSVGNAIITTKDIQCTNGFLEITDLVLVPTGY